MSEANEANLETKSPAGFRPLNWRKAAALVLGAAVCFHTAYTPANSGPLALLIVGYVVCLVQLARLRTTRQSFYIGLLTGFMCFGPQLGFFWRIFGPAAIALWAVLAFWIALFVSLAHVALVRLGVKRAMWLVPFLWTGLEYFRSELYYLKFSWLNVGFAFSNWPTAPFNSIGVYGIGLIAAALAASFLIIRRAHFCRMALPKLVVIIAIIGVLLGLLFPMVSVFPHYPRPNLVVAGVQLEFPTPDQIQRSLDKIVSIPEQKRSPWLRGATNVELIVLSEYTLDGPPPDLLKQWCRDHGKFLIVGGKDPPPGNNFYNTAFVIGTNGEVVFKQVKSVPIQFFMDGLPASEQKLWESPWGKIGICICYDLSYARVTDELVRQGAQMLIVPAMDEAQWGRHQHELHARIAPVRAAEYGIPIFRLASSGISQGVDRSGNVRTSAPFPGEGEMIFFGANLSRKGSLPLDRYLAPFAVAVTGAFVVWLFVASRKPRIKGQQTQA